MHIAKAAYLLFMLSLTAFAQSGVDACHVYVVDIAKSKKAFENFRSTGNEDQGSCQKLIVSLGSDADHEG